MWALEYSQDDDQFHVDPVSRVAESNLEQHWLDRPSRYVIIGLFRSNAEASEMGHKCRALLQKRKVAYDRRKPTHANQAFLQ